MNVSTNPWGVALGASEPPAPRRLGPRVWAGVVLLLAGLVLVGLSGCFLVGALLLITGAPVWGPGGPALAAAGPSGDFLLGTLYALAFACAAGAVALFFFGARGLLRVLNAPE